MKKEKRIKKAAEFQSIMQRKRFKNSGSFCVYIKERAEENARFGIAVPKRLGNAVFRNKAKRQIREMLHEITEIPSDYDYIVLVRKNYLESSYEENRKDLENLLKTVKI
ncbi:ribonuclease P protein component [Erysipelothrix sp. HDW6C]|uniref:ribonuclease P protein component n=1 Tax=Erysipelothrix sp. HDW6C TaxID=2714930 RepID=UPI00140B74BD|nr:ribonuclease P protein component [Erysipelothrix sp. HDW6C]QIK69079.1 ribonuclease P protein component [Erysipelothrix sp. HDW6C]